MVTCSMFVSRAENMDLSPRPGQTKDYIIGICCFSAKQEPWRIRAKIGYQDNEPMSLWSDTSTQELLFQWESRGLRGHIHSFKLSREHIKNGPFTFWWSILITIWFSMQKGKELAYKKYVLHIGKIYHVTQSQSIHLL